MKHYCVISHTHWDREWYQTQEEFRIRLVDLMDHLLEILDTQPDYIFHMDAQTIVFEDYWDIRPEMREKCCRYIKEGRIIAGPWYVQNDFFLTSGEATVRNLLIGMKQADEMGRCGKTGYTPDQFGLISQLPQIFKGFEIDHCIFGRGYGEYSLNEEGSIVRGQTPTEFLWKGSDGSEVLAIYMHDWYNNAQRFSADIGKACQLAYSIQASMEDKATTPYLLLMNGVDHLEPQPDLLTILPEIQKTLPEGEHIYQTTMEHYVDLVRNAKAEEDMAVENGELMSGINDTLLKDTASSRIYLKTKNSELQNMLENRLEPLYALLEMRGMDDVYPAGYLDYMWRMLIRNHAHDSICGCSTDAVHRHMEDRFETLEETGRELIKRGMKHLATHVREGFDNNDYQIVVFNALEHARTETVDVTVDIVAEDEPKGIKITAPDGTEVPFELLNEYKLAKSVFSAINLPGNKETVRYEIRMLAKDVPGFGYKVYRVQTKEQTPIYQIGANIVSQQGTSYYLENEYVKAEVMPSGQINLVHKESGHTYENILTVKDVADIGNAYIFAPAQGDSSIDIADFTPSIELEVSDAFAGKVRMHYEMILPAYYDVANQKRSDETVVVPVDIYVSLKAGHKELELAFEVENHAKDHRMRAFVRTGLKNDMVSALSPYDIISRNKWDLDKRISNETEHNSGMVTICQDELGFSVLNRGIYDYENLQDEEGTLTFTLIRCTGTISGDASSDDDAWKIPENQCLRTVRCEAALLPQRGNNMAEKAAFAAKAFQNPLMVQCEPIDQRKFLGGRAAVQDTTIAELFYQEIPYADVQMANEGEKLVLEGDGLQVTALKKAFDRSGYILRFYNMKETPTQAAVNFGNLQVDKVYKTNMKETAREELVFTDHQVSLPVGAKEIVTLFIK